MPLKADLKAVFTCYLQLPVTQMQMKFDATVKPIPTHPLLKYSRIHKN